MKKRRRTKPLEPSRVRLKQPEEMGARETEWEATMSRIDAKARSIAQDRERSLGLMLLAGKVAAYDPDFAQGLIDLVRGARREHQATRVALRRITSTRRR
jgi:hypothetical protein